MNINPTCIIHDYNFITCKRNNLRILDNKLNNLQNFNLYVICNLPTSPIELMFFGERSKLKKLIQRLEVLIINHCLTFIQQVKNSCKLNKLLFILHCLTIIQLLEDRGCRKLSIRNLIFHMHTFWVKKSEILLPKKTLNLTNLDPGSGQNLADSGLQLAHGPFTLRPRA
jgi:hypothetical protein